MSGVTGPLERANAPVESLKEKTLRSGLVRVFGQGANFAFRFLAVVALTRLLEPRDFGLVAMVTVVTGVYERFTAAGLSAAMVQKSKVTESEVSALFWLNILVGVFLSLLCLATAPVLVSVFGEPRLFWITAVVSAGFLLNAAGVQHLAILQRELRYFTITAIEAAAQLAGICVGVAMALTGFGYWSLVAMVLVSPAVSTFCAWAATGWIPRLERWPSGIQSMIRFGGTVTLNGLIVYLAYNFEKALIGRIWGAEALGIYGRAYQLISIPTASLNTTIGSVAFAALARLQDDHQRLKNYFLKGYALVVSVTLPITVFCAIYADEIVLLSFGPKWTEAAAIFRLLTPTILVFGMINPLWWLLLSVGLQVRSLKISLVIAPLVISAYFIGLPYGLKGVAFAYSAAMTLWLIPHIFWSLHGTVVSPWELLAAIYKALLAAIAAATLTLIFYAYSSPWLNGIVGILLGGSLMLGAYGGILLFVFDQRALFMNVLKGLRG